MRGLWALLAIAVVAGCGGSKDTTDTGASTTDPDDTGTPPTSDTTDTETTPPHTGDTGATATSVTIVASCAPTANVLRATCTVEIDPPQAVQVRFAPLDGTGPERVHTSGEAVGEHAVPLYLMPPDAEIGWTAEPVAGGVSVSSKFATAPLPFDVDGTGLVVSGTSAVRYVGTHHPCNSSSVAVIYDTVTGEVVWYQELDAGGTIGFFDMIQFTEDHTVLGETGPSIVEFALDGTQLVRFERFVDYDEYFHHDVFKRNGHIYAIYQDGGIPTLDGVKIFDIASHAAVADWAARDFLDIPDGAAGDWMHTNTVWVDEAGDIFLSSWTQDSVIKIDGDFTQPTFGEQVWALAGQGVGGFGHDFVSDYTNVPDDGFRNQHNVNFTPDGRLLMLDNDHGRGLLFTLDEIAWTARAEAEFPTGDWVCGPQGTSAAISTGGVFVGCSGDLLTEYDAAANEVWSGTAVCEAGPASVVRWYPLEGW